MLDLALNFDTNAHGDEIVFREDVKVSLMSTGLYEWLIKIVSERGDFEDDGTNNNGPSGTGTVVHDDAGEKEKETGKEKEKSDKDKKQLTGTSFFWRMKSIS